MSSLKRVKLGKCNNIYMNKSKKFKSIGISVVYKMKFDYNNITAFNILAKYLGNCNNKYPSIEKLNKYIESLYGSSVGIKSDYTGSLFTFNVYINLVNPKYVKDDSLIYKAVEVLHDIVYDPLIVDGRLDENIFNICKQNCMVDVESLKEYNLSYVLRTLKKQISNGNKNAMSASYLGDEKVLKHLDNQNILRYYKRLLHAPFDIYVTGDYSFNKMEKILKEFYKKQDIKSFKYSVFDLINDNKYEPIIIKKNVTQAKVAVAYKIPILFNDSRHYAFRIARLVLSGTLSAKFGKVIREKMGLCYSISSQYSSYYGTFIVTTGVASENIDKVIKEIDNQINEVKKGKVTNEEFNMAKEAILSDMMSVDDSLFGTLNMIKTYHSFNQEFDIKEEIKKYENVTIKDVINVSKLLKYCTYVVLDKE